MPTETNDQKAADMLTLERARELLDTLMIIQKNLALIQTGQGKTIRTGGGNLFQIAADEYGDAAQWTLIANANGLVDPFLPSDVTMALIIPALNGQDTGGLIDAQ